MIWEAGSFVPVEERTRGPIEMSVHLLTTETLAYRSIPRPWMVNRYTEMARKRRRAHYVTDSHKHNGIPCTTSSTMTASCTKHHLVISTKRPKYRLHLNQSHTTIP